MPLTGPYNSDPWRAQDSKMEQIKTLRLILGDQLNAHHSWFQTKDKTVTYLIAELKQEATYVPQHIQKICAFFAAMAEFADHIRSNGHQVLHLTLDESSNFSDFGQLISSVCSEHKIQLFEYQQPDEYRLSEQLKQVQDMLNIPVSCVETEHFLLTHDELPKLLKPHQHNRMESFYRKMRKRFDILLKDGEPVGGRWNFDAENRQKLKASDIEQVPQPLLFSNDVTAILERIKRHQINCIGHETEQLIWPINRSQALELLNYFCTYCLPLFGRFQDAMTRQGDSHWSLYHARISFALNSKLLSPMEVVETALSEFYKPETTVGTADIEGFIRQIIGWREYVRGMYWINMPNYSALNQLNAQLPLPDYFWTGDTKMACIKHAIDQSLDFAYAHHIQRLMVTGNFAMLAGINPVQVDQWYLGIYIDAIEWVELPNTRGMSQFADGGLIATKPYAASGSYINKMSDYCSSCHYKVKERSTEDACPLNSLYWHFMHRHRERFSNNPRTAMAYRSWDRMDSENRDSTLKRAQINLANINKL
jgi:deoxyribodipyrimidine photolyase-related protein